MTERTDRKVFVATKDDRPWWARPGERIPACERCNERPPYMRGLCGTCLANEAADKVSVR
jgi:hypothetical protein